MNSRYEFTLKEGPKVKMENFWETKSWRKSLKGLKRKVGIFIGTENIFNSINNDKYFLSLYQEKYVVFTFCALFSHTLFITLTYSISFFYCIFTHWW